MPARIVEKPKRKKGYWLVVTMVILFTVVFPALLLGFNIVVFRRFANTDKPGPETVEVSVEALRPSDVLNNMSAYRDQRITLAGRTQLATVACTRQDCPKEDTCCGCPEERNLLLADYDKELMQDSAWQMRLFSKDEEPFCRREPGSCDYQCRGWTIGDIYEVEGSFFADPPPPGSGWRLYEDFYLVVSDFRMVEESSRWDIPGRFGRGLRELWEGLRKAGGQYVLR